MLQPTPDLLNSSTAGFKKVPSSTNGSTAVTAVDVTADVTADIAGHVADINNLLFQLKALKAATVEVEETIGQHILAIKAAKPNNWEEIVKARCRLSRSRAYELIRIAEGTTSTEQVRAADAAKHRRLRAARRAAVRDVPDSERELAAARAQLAEVEEQHGRQVIRLEAEIAQLQNGHNLHSERDQLRKALGGIVELLAEMRGLLVHPVQHRRNIISKIAKAEGIATSAMKAATGKSTNSAMKVAA